MYEVDGTDDLPPSTFDHDRVSSHAGCEIWLLYHGCTKNGPPSGFPIQKLCDFQTKIWLRTFGHENRSTKSLESTQEGDKWVRTGEDE